MIMAETRHGSSAELDLCIAQLRDAVDEAESMTDALLSTLLELKSEVADDASRNHINRMVMELQGIDRFAQRVNNVTGILAQLDAEGACLERISIQKAYSTEREREVDREWRDRWNLVR